MPSDIPDSLRRLVIDRAGNRCEYCLLPQSVAFHDHEPDHIVPKQHGGITEESNLALACMRCNRYKGPNVGSYDPSTGKLVPFFNPRIHDWSDHFKLKGAIIQPITAEARVTIRILRLNEQDRVAERRSLIDAGLYGQLLS
ncbi:HNH endonuclease [candidate division KSB1 bacterium RBG_16_48_16]|nr:MAG: HNH endonuclease [candidate division KSB1 bacterium RBG_16_48_16]